jgi:tetrapyrrole (corrin/porphyrin) methylase-like protein
VLYLASDPVGALRIEALNPDARSLDGFYGPTKDRRETYAEVVDAIVAEVLAGSRVCAVFYGHPGFFANPAHEAVARVRAARLPARMLPAISSLDCLFADLGIDPGTAGLQCYEATHFFLRRPPVDPDATLVLLQVGMLGETGGAATPEVATRFRRLVDCLRESNGTSREAVLYEASPYPGCPPTVETFRLSDAELPEAGVLSTLCILSGR